MHQFVVGRETICLIEGLLSVHLQIGDESRVRIMQAFRQLAPPFSGTGWDRIHLPQASELATGPPKIADRSEQHTGLAAMAGLQEGGIGSRIEQKIIGIEHMGVATFGLLQPHIHGGIGPARDVVDLATESVPGGMPCHDSFRAVR